MAGVKDGRIEHWSELTYNKLAPLPQTQSMGDDSILSPEDRRQQIPVFQRGNQF